MGEGSTEVGEVSIEAGSGRGLPTVTRIVSHGAVWTAVLVPMFVVLTHGWTAGGDFASISIRAFQTTELPPPLVGMLSTAGTVGHNIFDPGPLLFWMLAIPVRIDPAHGALWGAALLGGAAMSVAVEATWSTGRWLGCAIIGFCALDLVDRQRSLSRLPEAVARPSSSSWSDPLLIRRVVWATR